MWYANELLSWSRNIEYKVPKQRNHVALTANILDLGKKLWIENVSRDVAKKTDNNEGEQVTSSTNLLLFESTLPKAS